MYKYLKYGAISFALLTAAALPAFALDLTVTGNGADSKSDIQVQQQNATVVSQSNTTSIQNVIQATGSSGGNKISGTTGGSSVINTGAATVDVNVDNTAGSNVAAVENCGCDADAVVADISNNGAGTDNDIKTKIGDTTLLLQENTTNFDNVVHAAAVTGDNTAKDNTNGDIVINSGKADVMVDVSNTAGANTGVIGGGSEGGSSFDAAIQKNGADSKNVIDVEIDQSAAIVQDNQTKIDNILAAYSQTGDNKVKDNTGGYALIQTGAALVDINVDNQAGFNSAALDCGCASFEVSATIKKNGADSASKIKAKLSANQTVSQTNSCGRSHSLPFYMLSLFGKKGTSGDCFDNHLTGVADTGYNQIKGSTDGEEGDPAILTGMSDVYIDVINTAGSNTYPLLYW